MQLVAGKYDRLIQTGMCRASSGQQQKVFLFHAVSLIPEFGSGLPNAEKEDSMRELVKYMAQHLVDHPAVVSVKEFASGQTVILELQVEKSDVGKVIGREGRTAQALRTILNAASRKQQKKTILEIID